jgi:predicted ribosome quality control (RQC) complex YloA/Tae2 family protein
MGARSNAILVSHEDNVIQACAYQVSSTTTVRPLQTGGVYQAPPSGGGIFSPIYKDSVEEKDYLPVFSMRLKELDVTVERSLVSCYRGMSPNIARRILEASKVDGSTMAKTLNDVDIRNIFRHFSAWSSIFDRSTATRMHLTEGPLPVMSIQPQLVEYGDKKNQEFCPISFPHSVPQQDTAAASVEIEAEVGEHNPTDLITSANPETDADGASQGSSLVVSKFLLSFYSLYERKAAFKLLHASCEKKVSLRIKKASKILKDFKEQEKDAR